jgi:hypothetical protein
VATLAIHMDQVADDTNTAMMRRFRICCILVSGSLPAAKKTAENNKSLLHRKYRRKHVTAPCRQMQCRPAVASFLMTLGWLASYAFAPHVVCIRSHFASHCMHPRPCPITSHAYVFDHLYGHNSVQCGWKRAKKHRGFGTERKRVLFYRACLLFSEIQRNREIFDYRS